MKKSFIDIAQDSSRAGLGIPVKTKNLLFQNLIPLAEPPFGFKLQERLVPVSSRKRLFRQPFARDQPISRRVCVLLPYGWLAPCERLSVGLSYIYSSFICLSYIVELLAGLKGLLPFFRQ